MADKEKKKHSTEPVKEGNTDEVSQEAIDRTVSEIENADSYNNENVMTEKAAADGRSDAKRGSEEIQDELGKARAQAKEMYERYLRSAADLDNYRKRMTKEAQESRKFANEELIKALIPTVDNLERALAHSEGSSDSGAFLEGIKMVHKQFMDTLEKFGVEQIDSLGKPFDPNFHQALMQVKTDEFPPNTVVSEVTKGYLLAGRLIRPSMVGVSVREGQQPAQGSPWGDEDFHKEEDVPDKNNGDTIDDEE
jgi:molecular chaperone GrpE